MSGRHSIIDDAQIWAGNHSKVIKTSEAKAAGKSLQEYHKDLPEIVGMSSELLTRLDINAGESRTTSRRVVDSALRELTGGGKEEYDRTERMEIVRKTLRDVLIQEAAGNEINRRGGMDPARELDRDPDRGQGEAARSALKRQGVDVENLFGHMTEHDLAKTSHGAYNKVSLIAHPGLVKALGVDSEVMNKNQVELNGLINSEIESKEKRAGIMAKPPVTEPRRRFQAPAPTRMPSFGKRIMAQQQMRAAGVAM